MTTGSWDGFNIGDSGAPVYLRVQEKFRDEGAGGFALEGFKSTRSPEDLALHGDAWKHWLLFWRGTGSLRLHFGAGKLSDITAHGEGWGPTPGDTVLRIGMSTDTVVTRLNALARRSEAWEIADLRLFEKDLQRAYDPVMADTAYFHGSGPDRVVWYFQLEKGAQQRLHFRNGVLVRIAYERWGDYFD